MCLLSLKSCFQPILELQVCFDCVYKMYSIHTVCFATAESELDFYGVSNLSRTFEECLNRQCWFIGIIDDQTLEVEESFFVTLEKASNVDSRIKLNTDTAEVMITNDSDGMLVIIVNLQEVLC